LRLTIEKLIYGGDGLARLPADDNGRGKAVFVPFVLANENVEVNLTGERPGFARAQLEKVVTPAPERIEPRCPYFARCGGCHYQHAGYEHQIGIKREILKENLRRIAKLELESEIQVHASPPWNYRNRTRLGMRVGPEFMLGYRKFGSEELLAVEECPISSPLINHGIAAAWDLGRAGKMGASIRELEFFANAEDTRLLVTLYVAHDSLAGAGSLRAVAEALRERLPAVESVAVLSERSLTPAAKIEKSHALLGSGRLIYQTAQASYHVSAGAFFQTNRHLTDPLVQVVTGGRSGTIALDLYAGVGFFSLVMARKFERVIAVESSPISHADLRYNAPANVKAVRAMAQEYLDDAGRKLRADLVVLDPPRTGLGDRVARSLAGLGAPRLTYVSCDPATQARDLVPLREAGYRVQRAHLVDLFPQTYHLESVLELVR
jgi:23S rRNA (uracil1939-C5)-methyltransferase